MKLFGSKQKGWSAAMNAIGKAESAVKLGKDGGASYELGGHSLKPRSFAQQEATKKAQGASAMKRKGMGGGGLGGFGR